MPKAYIVAGLGYGDEGKGSWVDHLTRKHSVQYIIRYNGGAQAAHHVTAPNGIEHVFAQFGSGTLVPDTLTCLSRFMLIEPEALLNEAKKLERIGIANPMSRLIICENAPIITPFNRLLNRIQETARGSNRHGSCGFGIGITQDDVERIGDKALYMRDLQKTGLLSKLKMLHRIKVNAAAEFSTQENWNLLESLQNVDIDFYASLFTDFAKCVQIVTEAEFQKIVRENDCIFEGAQGVLLDQQYGFYPHCTRSNTTFENAETLLAEAAFEGKKTRIGLLRGYGTRHGAGPFITEDHSLILPSCHNQTGDWQGPFRLGWFDAVAARYALDVVGGCDILAITNLDRMRDLSFINVAVQYRNADPEFFTEDRILVPEKNYRLLRRRTETMHSITPEYSAVTGVGQMLEGIDDYIDFLSKETHHTINAYSASTDENKTYIQKAYA